MFTGIARAVRIIVVLALSAGISGPKNTAARAYAQERATAQTTLLDKYPGQPPLPPSVIKREDLTRVVRADTKTERTPLPKPVEDPIQPSGEITKPLDAPLPEPRALPYVAPTNDMLPVVSVPGDPSDDKLQVGSFWTRNYTYDSVGNVTSAADASETLSYSYDALARLRGTSGTYTETYTYDDIGNLKDKGDPVNPGVQLGYPAAMQARPHAPTTYIPTQNGSYQTYWYDNNGNMTWRDEYSPGQTYMAFWQGYTPDNKLYIAVGYGWNAGAGQWEFNNVYSFFYYDADGQRVRKDDPNGTTAYAGAHFEKNAYTGVQRATYSFNGQVVAVRNGATTSWIHSDHLGSASLATDYTGVPIAGSETRYTPWGEVRAGGVGAITDRGFTSQRREDNLRLNDYVARFYDPFIGKFIQPDSVVPGANNPQAFNRYSYGFNSPLKYADPTGHDPHDDFGHTMNDQCNYVGGCTNQANPVIAHYLSGGGAPTAWNNLPSGHRAVFTGLGITQRGYEAETGLGPALENRSDEFAFTLASVVTGLRAAGWLVKGGQLALEWLGAKITQVCAANPTCITILIKSLESGSSGKSTGASDPKHHVFPQEFRDWFKSRGVNIDKYTLQMPSPVHWALHPEWNREWIDWIDDNPHATATMIVNKATQMIYEYGIEKYLPFKRF